MEAQKASDTAASTAMLRAAHQLGVGNDRAGNPGAVKVGPFLRTERIECLLDRAGKLRMRSVDTGIDHRQSHVGPAGQ